MRNFNEKYPYKVELTTSYPAFVSFEEGKVKYKTAVTDIFYNGHIYEISITDGEPESKVFNNIKSTILNSYKIAK